MNKYEVNSKLLFKKENKKTIIVDNIEDNEEYLVIKDIKTHEIQKIIPSSKDKTNTIPR